VESGGHPPQGTAVPPKDFLNHRAGKNLDGQYCAVKISQQKKKSVNEKSAVTNQGKKRGQSIYKGEKLLRLKMPMERGGAKTLFRGKKRTQKTFLK